MLYDRDKADSDWTKFDTFIVVATVGAFLLCVADAIVRYALG